MHTGFRRGDGSFKPAGPCTNDEEIDACAHPVTISIPARHMIWQVR